jgi:hypothetical protein
LSDDTVYELQQFIGLLDRTGQEIFEGDIVEQAHNQPRRKVVAWNNSGRQNGWNVANGNYYVVIGNLFENPNLLTKTA